VLADDWNDLFMVWLDDACPIRLDRFVVGLPKHIFVTPVHLSHLVEEILCLGNVVLSMVGMPVNHNIDSITNGGIHHCLHLSSLHSWILQIASWVLDPHRTSDESHLEILNQPIHNVSVPILAAPLRPKH